MGLGNNYLRLDGTKLVCKRKAGRYCVEYMKALDAPKCVTESPGHPKKKTTRAASKKKTAPKKRKAPGRKTARKTKIIMPDKPDKEFWEMTYQEFFLHAGSIYTAGERFGLPTFNRVVAIPGTKQQEKGTLPEGRIRRGVVRKAILEGKRIPKHVADEYPDLIAEVKPIKPADRPAYDMQLIFDILSEKSDRRFDRIVDEGGMGAKRTGDALESLRQFQKVKERPYHAYRRTSGSLSGVNLAGDLLTCSKWEIRTKNGTEYVRCAEYEQTCPTISSRDVAKETVKKEPPPKKKAKKAAPSPAKKQAPPESALWNLKRGDLWKMTRPDFIKLFGDVFVTATTQIPIDEISGREFEKRHGTEKLTVEPAKEKYVQKYVKMLEEGSEPPPIRVFGKAKESDKYDLYDGHRRVLAALEAGYKTINAEVTMVDENGRSLSHQKIIADAISAGEEVPAAVLKDYPEFKPPSPPKKAPETKYKPPAAGAHLKDAPFTEKEMQQYNYYTFFPQDFNKEYGESVRGMETAVKQNLDDHGIKELPQRLDAALQWYRKQLYDFYLVKFRSRAYAPPPMVVGPANYPTHRIAKAEARDRKAYAKVEKAKAYVERAEGEATKEKVSFKNHGDVVEVALHMKKIAFGKWYHENEKKKLKDDDSSYAAIIREGQFAKVLREKGRTLHEKIVRHVVAEGRPVIAEVVNEYPDLRAAAGILPSEEADFNIGAEAADQAFKEKNPRATGSPVAARAAKGVYTALAKKKKTFDMNEKVIGELWEFAFTELKDPLTLDVAIKGMSREIKDYIHAGGHLDQVKRLEAVIEGQSTNWPERVKGATDYQDAKGRLHKIVEGSSFSPSEMKVIENDIEWALKHAVKLKAMSNTLKALDRTNKNIVPAVDQVAVLIRLANAAAGAKRKQYEEAEKVVESFKGVGLLLRAGTGYNKLPIPPAFR